MTATPLLDQIRRDADAEVDRRRAGARAEADRLETAAATRLAETRHAALAGRMAALGSELARAQHVQDRRRKLAVLGARRRLVDRALDLARDRAWRLATHPDTARALGALLHQALGFLPDGATVRCPPELEPVLEDAARSRGAVVVAEPGTGFGFVAESGDGYARVDATVGALLARARDELSINLVRRHLEPRA